MATGRCRHDRKVRGAFQGDLSRDHDPQPSRYSAEFRISICASCGLVEFYCESPKDACAWLAAEMLAIDAANSPSSFTTSGSNRKS
jgi:hypothetical protein